MHSELLLDYDFAATRGEYVVRALLRLRGRPPRREGRIPLNLSLVLDRSGSMEGEKLAAAKAAAAHLVQRLFPEDVVSVVAYDDQVQTVAQPASGPAQADLSQVIGAIGSGGTTNLSGGWLRGRELVAVNARAGGVNRVLLLTDGLANVGITDPATLCGLCATAREAGVTTSTMGFGEGFNEHLLTAMADAGGGHTYYIERADQAAAVFADEVEGLLTLAAQNVRLDVHAHVPTRVLHSFPQTTTPEGLRLELGDLYAREPKQVLLEFAVPAAVGGGDVEVAELVVAADVLTEAGGVERQEVRLRVCTPLERAGRVDAEVRREVLLLEAARSRQEALQAEARGDLKGGERWLREAAARLREVADPGDAVAMEEAGDLDRVAERFAAGAVSVMDQKYMHQRAYDASRSKRASIVTYSRTASQGPVVRIRGDATQPMGPGRKIVLHAASDGGQWGNGFGRAISARWPDPEAEYRGWTSGTDTAGIPFALGSVRFMRVDAHVVVAVLLVKASGLHPTPRLDYAALAQALDGVAEEALRTGASVHLPRIATVEGRGHWHRIERLLEDCVASQGVPVTVYDPT